MNLAIEAMTETFRNYYADDNVSHLNFSVASEDAYETYLNYEENPRQRQGD